MAGSDVLFGFYHAHYKKFLVFSLIVLFACLSVLTVSFVRTGEFAQRGVSLKGGMTLTIPVNSPVSSDALKAALSSELENADINVRAISERGVVTAIIIEASDVEEAVLLAAVEGQDIPLVKGEYSLEIMASGLGENFFRQTIIAVIFAFLLMSIVVYITFRSPLPSLFVILCAFSDIVSTLAIVSLLGVKLSTAGIAAFLMMVGYSVDNNILLTVRALKRNGGSLKEGMEQALRTGLLMTLTALVAIGVGYAVTDSDVIKQIMFILLVGLLFDIIYTWAQNGGILRWYLEKKGVA